MRTKYRVRTNSGREPVCFNLQHNNRWSFPFYVIRLIVSALLSIHFSVIPFGWMDGYLVCGKFGDIEYKIKFDEMNDAWLHNMRLELWRMCCESVWFSPLVLVHYEG